MFLCRGYRYFSGIGLPGFSVLTEELSWSVSHGVRGRALSVQGSFVFWLVWSRVLSWKVVSRLFGVSWNTVASAVKSAVTYSLANRDAPFMCINIGIDEISRKKGHVYMTVIYDLGRKRMIWAGEGRKEETLRRFFVEWGQERVCRIEGICCDMWAPYLKVIREYRPTAVLVFDKFHLVRHLLEAVDKVRRMEAKAMKVKESEVLKGTRYLWLKNPWNLTPKQKQRLGYLQNLNLKIIKTYLLKELFKKLWGYKTPGWARRYLRKWFWWATHSRIRSLRDFAWFLRRYEKGILGYFRLRISNGVTEAMNNNAKQVSHRAHGFRSSETFSLNLYHYLGQFPLPQPMHRF